MRKIVLLNSVSLDGYFAGPGGDLSWHRIDEEFDAYALGCMNAADGLIMGRVTYELMHGYWPAELARNPADPIARRMGELPKHVASTSLQGKGLPDWQGTHLLGPDPVADLRALRQEPGDELLILGSGKLAACLRRHGLIDEYRLVLTPVLVGAGRPMFEPEPQQAALELVSAWPMRSGNVVLTYRPQG